VKSSTYNIVKAAIESDDTIAVDERQAIMAFCKRPVAPVHSSLPSERWLSPRQAAGMLSVSLRTIQRLVSSGAVPSLTVLGCRRISESALAASLASPVGNAPVWPQRQPTAAGDFSQADQAAV
jgi:excisionase family DNA binding protein